MSLKTSKLLNEFDKHEEKNWMSQITIQSVHDFAEA